MTTWAASPPPWQTDVEALYSEPNSSLLWLTAGQPSTAARLVLDDIANAEARGLAAEDYSIDALGAEIARITPAMDPIALQTLDKRLSLVVAHYISDLNIGRISPRAVGHDLDLQHAPLNLGTAVRALAATRNVGGVLDEFEPGFHHYDLLKDALRRYRELARDTELTRLPPLPARTVKPGEIYAGAPFLRRLLTALGDMPPAAVAVPAAASNASTDIANTEAPVGVLDDGLVQALKKFQDRHGIKVDGVLGLATFRLLTTPLTQRVRQIEWSLERARWLPPRLETPPILVNIPQFRLFAFSTTSDREDSLLQMRVVVGKTFPRNNTPVFAADMRQIVLRPYWDVPRTILLNEFMSRIENQPGWLAANRFEIVAGAGDDGRVMPASTDNIAALRAGRLRLRQQPGANNALGVAKFMFPNRHNVYFHGTTAQGLFAEASRAFSHGCVRLENPLQLAEFLLRNDPNWNRAAIDAAVQSNTPSRRITLTTPVRVFIMYATAIATEAGEMLFFEDIYGHDARLAAALSKHRASKPKASG